MDAVPAKVLAKFSASHHNHMFFPDEVGFCDPIGGESHVDGFASYEAEFESAVPPLFPFGEADEAAVDMFHGHSYTYEPDPDWGDDHLELGSVIPYDKGDCGHERQKRKRAAYGTGPEAKRLRAVNVKTPEKVSYKKAVEEMVGRVCKPRLKKLADAFEEQHSITIGRDKKRGVWSLWEFFMEHFPNPADFVAFLA